ncbi:MAG: NAD(P)/FAD-dependent oxidoreductase [Acidimicrobiales bacterium]
MEDYDVVIVGGGFGGFYAARQLERSFAQERRRRVLLVAQENFFLFSPLLPEAASGTLEPRHAVIPLRSQLSSTEIVAGTVTSIDLGARTAVVADRGKRWELLFRSIVLAPGSVPSTLPVPGLAEAAVGFKTLADAIWLRNRVLAQMEAAEATEDPVERRALLTFTFVGGGYAGVEALAELESLAQAAVRSYHRIRAEDMRWVLVEAAPTLLPGISHRLARYTERQLRARGIEVRLATRLVSCQDRWVRLDDQAVAPFRSRTIVWTTGQRPSPLLQGLGIPVDDRGRVVVDDHLRVPGHPGTYAVGDGAAVPDPTGGTCPATAQHAMRQGIRAGANVAADHGAGQAGPFTYRNRGLSVTLGNGKGTAQVYRATFTGPLAWWMGRSYHLLMMPGLARRARIVSDWTIGALFPRDISQLGTLGSPSPLPPPR